VLLIEPPERGRHEMADVLAGVVGWLAREPTLVVVAGSAIAAFAHLDLASGYDGVNLVSAGTSRPCCSNFYVNALAPPAL
jgi:hypothetical protein